MVRFNRTVGSGNREYPRPVGPDARAKMWRDALGIANIGRNASRLTIALQHRQLGDECVREFCDWFRKQAGLLTRRGIEVHVDTFDLSNNYIGNDGLVYVAAALLDIAPKSLRVLKLHHNQIEDAAALVDIITKGQLAELHLSHNHSNAKSIFEPCLQYRI